MSFSSDVKSELCKTNINRRCCNMAELSGCLLLGSHIENGRLKIITENPSVARRIFTLHKMMFDTGAAVTIKKNTAQSVYHVVLNDADGVMRKTGSGFRVNNDLILDECCKKAFIRGAFLGGGSMIDPERSYHMEFVTHHRKLSEDFCALIEEFDIEPGVVMRKSNYIIYFKNSGAVADILNISGAHKALMRMENMMIVKDVKNNVNRVVNCETANVSKTVEAAVAQIKAINKIKNAGGLGSLPEHLRAIAELRLENPESSISELAQMSERPITKSGVSHRLNKIIELSLRK